MITDNPRDGDVIVKEGIATRLFFSFTDQLTRNVNDKESTTSDLEDITAKINTNPSKVLGFMILNTTTGATVFASGNTDGAVWHYYDSTLAHTPI